MKRLFVAYVIALHALCIALIFKTDALDRAKAKIVKWGFADAIPVRGKPVYLGDSITFWMPSKGVNLGVVGQTAEELARTTPDLSRAQSIHLHIGVNDIIRGQASELPTRYRAILARLPENVPLTWTGVMPAPAVPRDDVDRANEIAKALCAQRPLCLFVDVRDMPRDDFLPDGVHLTTKGYHDWLTRE